MSKRKKIGYRNHVATFQQHDASQDSHGQPSYPTGGDWDTVVTDWPCELITTSGGESLRGRQVTETTTHVFYGEYFGAEGVTADMRMIVGGDTYAINTAYDPNGDRRELRVEAKREG